MHSKIYQITEERIENENFIPSVLLMMVIMTSMIIAPRLQMKIGFMRLTIW